MGLLAEFVEEKPDKPKGGLLSEFTNDLTTTPQNQPTEQTYKRKHGLLTDLRDEAEKGFMNFGKTVLAVGPYIAGAIAGDDTEFGRKALQLGYDIEDWHKEDLKPQVSSYKDIKSTSDFGMWAANTIGEQLPFMAVSLGGGAAGASIGTKIGGSVGAKAGALLGSATASGIVQGGSYYGERARETGTTDHGTAAIAVGVINGALDAIPDFGLLQKFGLMGRAKTEVAKKLLKDPVWVNMLKTGVIQGGKELPTEITQEFVEITAKYVDEKRDQLFSKEFWDEVKLRASEAGTKALLGGGLAGMAGGGAESLSVKGQFKDEITEIPTKTPLAPPSTPQNEVIPSKTAQDAPQSTIAPVKPSGTDIDQILAVKAAEATGKTPGTRTPGPTPTIGVSRPADASNVTPPATEGGGVATKQPWEMTKEEWDVEFEKNKPSISGSHIITAANAIGKSKEGAEKSFANLMKKQNWLKMNLPDTVLNKGTDNELQIPARHFQVIQHALSQGLPVPPEVLAEYPELQSPASTEGGAPTVKIDEELNNARIEFDALSEKAKKGYDEFWSKNPTMQATSENNTPSAFISQQEVSRLQELASTIERLQDKARGITNKDDIEEIVSLKRKLRTQNIQFDQNASLEELRKLSSYKGGAPTVKENATVEPPATPAEGPEPSLTSARQAMIEADREKMLSQKAPTKEKRGWHEAKATAIQNGIPDKALRIASAINIKPEPIDDITTAGLVVKAEQLKQEHADLMKKIGQSTDDADVMILSSEVNRVQDEFDSLTTAIYKSGSEKGRALAAQKLTINQDYDIVSVVNRARAAKGKKITAQEEAVLTELTKKMQASEERITNLENKIKELEAKRSVKEGVSKRYNRMNNSEKNMELSDLYAKASELLRAGCNPN